MTGQKPLVASLTRSKSIKILLLFVMSVFGLIILFHDYPGHDHFSFIHDIIYDQKPGNMIEASLALHRSGFRDAIGIGFNVNPVSDMPLEAGNIKQLGGFRPCNTLLLAYSADIKWIDGHYPLSSDLSPPQGDIIWANTVQSCFSVSFNEAFISNFADILSIHIAENIIRCVQQKIIFGESDSCV